MTFILRRNLRLPEFIVTYDHPDKNYQVWATLCAALGNNLFYPLILHYTGDDERDYAYWLRIKIRIHWMN